MNDQQRMKLMREIAVRADQFYNDAEQLGNAAAKSLTARRRSQMNGLENVANSTLKVSDILDYIKTRTARSDKGKDWQKDDFGKSLLTFIENTLRNSYRRDICGVLSLDENSPEAQQVYLYLIRAFVHQLVAHYEFVSAGGE